jgi:hypothetical protein
VRPTQSAMLIGIEAITPRQGNGPFGNRRI